MAIQRAHYRAKSRTREATDYRGSFRLNGSGAPDTVYGDGVTVSRTGTGSFRLTLEEWPAEYLGTVFQVALATPLPTLVVVTSHSPTNRTIDFAVYQESGGTMAAVDIAAAQNSNRVSFLVLCANAKRSA